MIREIGMDDEDPNLDREEADLAGIGSADQLPVGCMSNWQASTCGVAARFLDARNAGRSRPGAAVQRVAVTLREGGRKLASGNLISIDDRFAVRLSTVGMTPPKADGKIKRHTRPDRRPIKPSCHCPVSCAHQCGSTHDRSAQSHPHPGGRGPASLHRDGGNLLHQAVGGLPSGAQRARRAADPPNSALNALAIILSGYS